MGLGFKGAVFSFLVGSLKLKVKHLRFYANPNPTGNPTPHCPQGFKASIKILHAKS